MDLTDQKKNFIGLLMVGANRGDRHGRRLTRERVKGRKEKRARIEAVLEDGDSNLDDD